MKTLQSIDSPWHRLPWTLPSALVIWAVALWGLALFMGKPTPLPVETPPIDAQFIEQPVMAVTQKEQPAEVRHPRIVAPKPAALHQPKLPSPARPQPPLSKESAQTEQNPATQKAEVTTNTVLAVPGPAIGDSHAIPEAKATAATGNIPVKSGAQTGSSNGKGRGNMYANSGARAMIRPMPQIPDDLRDGAFHAAALARFHIAADGSVAVELTKPTPNPRLNRLLLDSLKKWRFMPAIKDGKPVASTEEIVVKVEVK